MEKSITRKGLTEGKKPWGLVDFEALRHLAPHYAGGWQGANWNALECMLDVLIFGANKYAPNNWKKGYKLRECTDSLYRHIIALMKGEHNDPETGLSHYGHVLCNLMFISYWVDYVPEVDDRVTNAVACEPIGHEEPVNEAEALRLLLATLGAFMNGNNYDPDEELHLLGYAMHYACVGYAFQNVPVKVGCECNTCKANAGPATLPLCENFPACGCDIRGRVANGFCLPKRIEQHKPLSNGPTVKGSDIAATFTAAEVDGYAKLGAAVKDAAAGYASEPLARSRNVVPCTCELKRQECYGHCFHAHPTE
jgi:hypothetical protein